MPECTRTALVVSLIVAIACSYLPALARADGDPASDVLATQSLFLPQDGGLSAAQQSELATVVQRAGASGYRIRVAVIASPADLGSVTVLWREPQQYARFLGQELSLVYKGPLLVVMPNGFGLAGARMAPLGLAAPGAGLGAAAVAAVRRLAAAAGHPVALPAPAGTGSRGSTDTLPWVVFGVGVLLIAVAWAVSLRARPLWAGGRPTSAT